MIPIRVRHKTTSPPVLTYLFAACSVAVSIRLATFAPQKAAALMRALAVVPSELLSSHFDPERLLTLVTASFLHAGWIHLLGNMLYLLVFGPAAEDRLGHLRFSAVYLVSGILGMFVQAVVDAGSSTPVVGASASIAGVLGAYLIVLPKSKVTTVVPVLVAFEIAHLPAAFLVLVWFLIQVAGALSPGTAGAHTAWSAHVAGFVVGALLALTARNTRKRRR